MVKPNVDLNGKSILVTGGTGSFGKKFIETVLHRYPDVKRLVVFSRDELKQYEMAKTFSEAKYPAMRYFIGDVRDRDRLKRAFQDIDIVIHAAALKHVPVAEYNPMEFIKTNVLGAENIIEAAYDCGVQEVVALSTDKAAAPINLYGASKLCSDKLFVAANTYMGRSHIKLSVVRYGNVMGSRGSVIPFFLNQRNNGKLPITDENMTRFNISLEDGVELVLFAIGDAVGGEIYVPKLPSYKITEVAEAVAPNAEIEVVGIRPGEKLHEDMITEADALNTFEFDNYFVMAPSDPQSPVRTASVEKGGKPVPYGFRYNSGGNDDWLTVDQLRDLVRAHVDPNFQP